MNGAIGHLQGILQRSKERKEKNIGKFGKRPSNSHYNSDLQFEFPELSASELEQVKISIREKIKADKKRRWMLSGIIFILVVITIFLVI